jgi:hypothetical protein
MFNLQMILKLPLTFLALYLDFMFAMLGFIIIMMPVLLTMAFIARLGN